MTIRPPVEGARFVDFSSRDAADGAVESWIAQLASAAGEQRSDARKPQIHYILARREVHYVPRVDITAHVAATHKDGSLGATHRLELNKLTQTNVPYVSPIDRAIGRLVNASGLFSGFGGAVSPHVLAALFEQLIASGRTHWNATKNAPLVLHRIERGRIAWQIASDGRQRPCVEGRSQSIFLPSTPVWYVDTSTWEAGPVDLNVPPDVAARAIAAPSLTPKQANMAQGLWRRIFPTNDLQPPGDAVPTDALQRDPVPVIRLSRDSQPLLELQFAYGDRVIRPNDRALEFHEREGDDEVVWPRRFDAEHRTMEALFGYGLHAIEDVRMPLDGVTRTLFGYPEGEEYRWARFLDATLPHVRASGWRVHIDPTFTLRVLELDDDAWDARVEPNENRWFELDLGIVVNGTRVPLLPILTQALHDMDVRSFDDFGENMREAGSVYARVDGDAYVALPKARLATILSTLVELFDDAPLTREGRLPLTLSHASALDDLDREIPMAWAAAEPLRAVLRTMAQTDVRVELPDTFEGELRPYQHAGVAWLQTLRENGLGGVLADDMGLGKTVQLLAHASLERASGRATAPMLIVAPTSVVPNWRSEIARFAPTFRVVDLTGSDRSQRYDLVDGADVAITTYALLLRDAEFLLEREWEIAVLDEAQAVKNPRSKGAQTALQLRAKQRLALTGTPIENHLDELWSIASFAMPGLLGDRSTFTRVFRTPIEKRGEGTRRTALARRIRPFLLRRTKELVASELPEKTEVIQRIELQGAQRDLYETIRLAMHGRVLEEVRRVGLARSRIVVLDALLKLRQVCCDPRLVKLPAAGGVTESAKLDALVEMLESLIEDGRRVLLFSQFTSMLDLIAPVLRERGIAFVELRGETKDRETPVRRFQEGEVPLFLISLKAGGTGLNLTAADTVIHYDPWWNPAVERQATDRAHRIGQHKPVFVYKFIAVGTVEERIVEMQARKGALADSLFDETSAVLKEMDLGDIDRLFAPLE